MTPDQFARLLDLLEKMAAHQYTLTNASDWPLLVWMGGFLITALAAMWIDLKATIKEHRSEWRVELDKHKLESEKAVEQVWTAMKDCQGDCCPREKK